jgi:hypothetical protein
MTYCHHRFQIFERHWRMSIMATNSLIAPFCVIFFRKGLLSLRYPPSHETPARPPIHATKHGSPEISIWQSSEEKIKQQLTSLPESLPTRMVSLGNSSMWWVHFQFILMDHLQPKNGGYASAYFVCSRNLRATTDPKLRCDGRND